MLDVQGSKGEPVLFGGRRDERVWNIHAVTTTIMAKECAGPLSEDRIHAYDLHVREELPHGPFFSLRSQSRKCLCDGYRRYSWLQGQCFDESDCSLPTAQKIDHDTRVEQGPSGHRDFRLVSSTRRRHRNLFSLMTTSKRSLSSSIPADAIRFCFQMELSACSARAVQSARRKISASVTPDATASSLSRRFWSAVISTCLRTMGDLRLTTSCMKT